MRSLTDLKPGEISNIRAWVYFDEMLPRLAGLGLSIGKEIEVLRNGWFRPIHVRIGMTELFIRKSDAQNLWVD